MRAGPPLPVAMPLPGLGPVALSPGPAAAGPRAGPASPPWPPMERMDGRKRIVGEPFTRGD